MTTNRTHRNALQGRLRDATAGVLVTALLLVVTGCSSTELDSDGRWVGGGRTMTAWVDSHVPSTWDQVDSAVTYQPIIDDFGEDTKRDSTLYAATYRGVTEDEFARFGAGPLMISKDLECEPYDAAIASPEDEPSIKSCVLSLYQGERPLPDEFDLLAVWTVYPDGSTTTDLYLTNDPR